MFQPLLLGFVIRLYRMHCGDAKNFVGADILLLPDSSTPSDLHHKISHLETIKVTNTLNS
jgi:hypothetical protein